MPKKQVLAVSNDTLAERSATLALFESMIRGWNDTVAAEAAQVPPVDISKRVLLRAQCMIALNILQDLQSTVREGRHRSLYDARPERKPAGAPRAPRD